MLGRDLDNLSGRFGDLQRDLCLATGGITTQQTLKTDGLNFVVGGDLGVVGFVCEPEG